MYNFRKYCKPVLYQLCFKRYTHRNYYDSLGISPKSSQGDIKKAYYNLSMRYHPDKAEGSESRFREITAAYEVLGNVKLRRLYDQGVINIATRQPSPEDLKKAEPQQPGEQSRFYRSKTPSTGRTQFYDYDEWSRMHYQRTLNRDIAKKSHRMRTQTTWDSRRAEDAGDNVIKFFVAIAGLVAFLGLMTSSASKDYDKPSPRLQRLLIFALVKERYR
ncbi:unnamed protein product [Allacma fusca]|uniref:J domain-containing protein n=1 Tax=Allacma fusca TaxID=39272 RepID=A0A8J2JMA2_9HEXA|nr:unnamed protein product [Allacma fusca]